MRRPLPRREALLLAFATAVLLGATPAAASPRQPLTFYGLPVSAGATLNLVARNAGTTYLVVRLDTGATMASGTLAALAEVDVAVPSDVPLKVDTGDIAFVHLGADCCGVGGQLEFPADDGTTRVGRSFVLFRPVAAGTSELYVAAQEPANVTIRTAAGAVVAVKMLGLGQLWVEPPIAARTVYTVTSTGNVSIHVRAPSGFKPAAVVDSPGASCDSDVGRSFVVGVKSATDSAFAVFDYGKAQASIGFTPVTTGVLYTLSVGSGAMGYQSTVADNVYLAASTDDVAVWGGDPQDGSVDDFGDDIAIHLGQGGKRLIVRSQNFPGTLFAGEDGTMVSVNGAPPFAMNKDHYLGVAKKQMLTVTSNKPIVIQTQGGGAPTSWGEWLRPIPHSDTDGDGWPDTNEGPPCLSAAPDSDGDGVPDFLDLDSDNDCVLDARELTNAARVDPTLPAGPHCANPKPFCDPTQGVVGVCRGCAVDKECAAPTPACLASGVCAACSAANATQCSGATPVCDLGKNLCRGCLTDGECGGASPACVAGACVQCSARNKTQCSGATPICDAAKSACRGCASDLDCPVAAPACLPSGGCGQCSPTNKAACKGTTPVCERTKATCRACAADAECDPATPACQASGALAGSCGFCSANNNSLCGGSTPFCDVAKAVCRGCLTDGECPAATPACQPGGSCSQCSSTNAAQCGGATPVCYLASGTCQLCTDSDASACAGSSDGHACQSNIQKTVFCGCFVDSDCGSSTSGRVCDPLGHKCADGCSPAPLRNGCPAGLFCSSDDTSGLRTGLCTTSCTFDKDCTGMPGSPLCLRGGDGGASLCVTCRSDGDCAGQASGVLCTADTHACVECTPGRKQACRASGKGAACLAGGSCGCLVDKDCGGATSARICDPTSGVCVVGCRGTGNGCGAGMICSSTGAMAGECGTSFDMSMASPRDLGIGDAGLGEDVDLSGGGVGCAVAGGAGRTGDAFLIACVALALALARATRRRRRNGSGGGLHGG